MVELETQVEIPTKGEPDKFAVMAEQFAYELAPLGSGKKHRYTPVERLIPNPNIFASQTEPGANPVIVILMTGKDDEAKGAIEAHWRPGGSWLRVKAKPDDWPMLKESWELLLGEMKRQGWLDVQQAASGTPPIVTIEHADNVQVGVNVNIGGDVIGRDKDTTKIETKQ